MRVVKFGHGWSKLATQPLASDGPSFYRNREVVESKHLYGSGIKIA